jgi:cytochrome c-type biogenesis protein CcmF
MIAELGHFCLCLAAMVALLQALTPLAHRLCAPHGLLPLTRPLAMVYFMLVSAAFAALMHAYVTSDFSVMNVVLNSHSSKPLIYKIAGLWGNHEGSMLLWAWMLAAYGAVLAWLRPRERELYQRALAVMGMVAFGLLAFILLTSNPFLRVWPVPADGEDLNPLLQDIGLSFHPPTLYMGYVGFAVVFCMAVAGLWRGRIDSAWAKAAHPFILIPWIFLTLGIGAGSWWAYRELGWGGWWFWDPVENVSLLPWLTSTALLHANMVLEKRGQLARWVALLSIITFSMSLIGTFIVRSGLITSVHSFASDPARGLFILCYIFVTTGAALTMYAFCPLPKTASPQLASRAGLILIGNVLLCSAMATVLLAILYPVFLELTGAPGVSVGAPYFNRTFLPLAAPLAVLAALAPLLAWDRFRARQLKALAIKLAPSLLVAALMVLAVADHAYALAFIGGGLGLWLIHASAMAFWRAQRAGNLLATARGMRQLASVMAHLSLAVFILGVTTTSLFRESYEAPLVAKQDLQFGNYTLKLLAATQTHDDNYDARRAKFSISRGSITVATLTPELRYYAVRGIQTTEAALYSTPLRDLYLAISDAPTDDGKPGIRVRFYVMPGQQWIWGAFLLAGGGGMMALLASLRRRRGVA